MREARSPNALQQPHQLLLSNKKLHLDQEVIAS